MYAWNKKQEKTILSLFKKYHITDKFIKSLLSINHSYLISIVKTFEKDEKKKQELGEDEHDNMGYGIASTYAK